MTPPSALLHIGIDLGGTKIAGIAMGEGRASPALWQGRVPTPRDDYPATVAAIAGLVARIEGELGRGGSVGVAMPGTISPAGGLVRNANSTWLNGRPLREDLAAALGRPVRLANDADCLAVSEAVDGAGAGARLVWAVILGTGAGSGIAIEGRPWEGRNRIAGEWGHNPLPAPRDDERPGPPCWCGRSGCLETFVSGPGFAADHARATGQRLAADAIVAAMRAGDPGAAASFGRLVDRLGRGFATVVNVLDPDIVVLGGGLSRIPELVERLPRAMSPHVFSDHVDTPVRRSLHGDASGVRGAAWLWREEPA